MLFFKDVSLFILYNSRPSIRNVFLAHTTITSIAVDPCRISENLETLKAQLKQTPKLITWGELEDKFNRLLPGRKRLMGTVRIIAYRSETAIAAMLLEPKVDMPDARRLLQGLFFTDADLFDMKNNRLRVRIHNASTPADNRSVLKARLLPPDEAILVHNIIYLHMIIKPS